jgi:hypothetical protein
MKYKIHTETIKIPKGADVKALDKKVKLWADRRVYGISWNCLDGEVKVDFWMHTGNAKHKWKKDFEILKRIVARSAPKPPPPPIQPKQPRQWHKRLRGHEYEQDPNIYYLETPAHLLGDVRFTARFEVCRNYNGSGEHGKKRLGGHDSWPVLKLELPFRPGEEWRRAELILKLQEVLNKELEGV